MLEADRQARAADVLGLSRLVDRVHRDDRALGGQRPETVGALIAAVQAKLDSARRLRLARDQWALRAPAYRRYRTAIDVQFGRFDRMQPALEEIKVLAGSSPESLAAIRRTITEGGGVSFEEGLEIEREWAARLAGTVEFHAGVRAFLDSRKRR